MTILDLVDIDFDFDRGFASPLDAYDAAFDRIMRIRDLAELMEQTELYNLAHWLTRLTNDVIAAAQAAGQHEVGMVPIQGPDPAAGPDSAYTSTALIAAIDFVLQVRDLALRAPAAQLGHLAYRLAQITNDIVFAASNRRPSRPARFGAVWLQRLF